MINNDNLQFLRDCIRDYELKQNIILHLSVMIYEDIKKKREFEFYDGERLIRGVIRFDSASSSLAFINDYVRSYIEYNELKNKIRELEGSY